MDSSPTAARACHNCRRQRLRCDRSHPQCKKCLVAGKECLGYGKLFRWTGAIASRGKLAGRTSTAPLKTEDSASASAPAPAPAPAPASASASSTFASSPAAAAPNLRVARSCSPRFVARPDSSYDDAEEMIIPRAASAELEMRTPWVLVDPIFQDLGPSHRYYLKYFSDRLCKDLVAHDGPNCNPFRSLIALTENNPLLRYIIVAASAAHKSVLLRSTLIPEDADADASADASPGAVAAVGMALPNRQHLATRASTAAFNDALVAKQMALRLMSSALQDISSTGADVVLAAALFFVNVELIESGKNGWRAHLDGASRILSLVQHMKAWDSSLRDYLLSDCFVYFILATAFMPSSQKAFKFETSQISFVLSKATANSYFCCPPEILEILYTASELSNAESECRTEDEIAVEAAALLDRALALDVGAWAADIQSISSLGHVDVKSRFHAGSAHRLAACLYTLQAIPAVGTRIRPGLADTLSEEIFDHLSSIPDHDPNFKATSWPTFIAGAEAVDPARRAWIMDRLRRLVSLCPWGFFYTAMETLPIVWDMAEEQRGLKSWVQILKDPNLNFLLV